MKRSCLCDDYFFVIVFILIFLLLLSCSPHRFFSGLSPSYDFSSSFTSFHTFLLYSSTPLLRSSSSSFPSLLSPPPPLLRNHLLPPPPSHSSSPTSHPNTSHPSPASLSSKSPPLNLPRMSTSVIVMIPLRRLRGVIAVVVITSWLL
jgi:hypothetical protein